MIQSPKLADLLVVLQQLELDPKELDELTDALTTDGLTESVRRRVQAVLVRESAVRFPRLQALEQAEDLLEVRDATMTALTKSAEQSLNRLELQTKAKFETIRRKVNEDKTATDAGATLLLHTDDVAPTEAPSASTKSAGPTAPVELSPKQAAATTIAAAKASPTILPGSQPIQPSSPSLPEIPAHQPLPVTVAPLPPTPIAPPAVTEPTG